MKVRKLTWTAGALLALAACGDEEPLMPRIGDLGGTWDATLYEFRDATTGSQTYDLIADGGSFVMVVDSGNDPPTLTVTLEDPNGGETMGGGTVDVYEAVLTVGVGVFAIEHSGDQMTLTNPNAVYSFGAGVEPAIVTIELTRR